MGANDNEKTVGFLHDLIEDCDWSIEDLQTEGFLMKWWKLWIF